MNEAIIGLVGVLVGASLGIVKDFVAHWVGRRRKGHYAAVRIVSLLDEYVDKCVDVVGDDGTKDGRPACRTSSGEEYHEAQVTCPEPPTFPDDIDWTSISAQLMQRIHALPNLAVQTNRVIAAESDYASPPDYLEYFVVRWEGYADLGIEAVTIADELRKKFNLPKSSISIGNVDWDSSRFLRDKKIQLQKNKEYQQTARAEMIENLDSSHE